MTGTILNVIAVVIGSLVGVALGKRLPERLRQTVVLGIGLFSLAFGLRLFFQTQNTLVVLTSLIIGILLGEWWQIEMGLQKLGVWLEARFNRNGSQNQNPAADNLFVRGFFTTSLLYVIGPMAILGSIQDGLTGDYETLAIKAILDGVTSIAFASSLGTGVAFSALPIFIYQGTITLLAAQVQALMTEAMMIELTATGGILLVGIAISSLLEIKHIRVGNFLPALLLAPIITMIFVMLGLY